MASNQDQCKVFICALLLSCCSGAVMGHPNKRDVGFSLGPCADIEGAQANPSSVSFDETMDDVRTRANGLKLKADELMDHILTKYSIHFSTDFLNLLDIKEFMNKTGMESIETFIEPQTDALSLHHSMIKEHTQYVEATRTRGNFSKKESTRPTREKLLDYETDLISYACSVSIAVLAAGGTLPAYTEVDLVDLFDQLGEVFSYQVFRAYLTVRDGQLLASHLQAAYEKF